ncbi:hypothetical protein XENOCAPTIV_017761 [Xenoophorus captivus]|uniref:Uncharacterized protein n=1 Tax=Xenoophorus captivus TaxID=1517983 RepID=A0ABV0RHV1_9TELE
MTKKLMLCLGPTTQPGVRTSFFKTALANSNFMFFRQSPCMQGIVKIVRREKKERETKVSIYLLLSRGTREAEILSTRKETRTHLLLVWALNHSHQGPQHGGATANLSL